MLWRNSLRSRVSTIWRASHDSENLIEKTLRNDTGDIKNVTLIDFELPVTDDNAETHQSRDGMSGAVPGQLNAIWRKRSLERTRDRGYGKRNCRFDFNGRSQHNRRSLLDVDTVRVGDVYPNDASLNQWHERSSHRIRRAFLRHLQTIRQEAD